jgi:uncharacterized membrane protein
MSTTKPAAAPAEAIEEVTGLDGAADTIRAASSALPSAVRDVLTGAALGSPLHPALVHLPIGAAICAVTVAALTDEGQSRSVRLLAGLTVAAALPAALTGLADFGSLGNRRLRRTGAAHAVANTTGTLLALAAWVGAGSTGRPSRTLLAGATVAYLAGGYLGGDLVHDEGHAAPGSDD